MEPASESDFDQITGKGVKKLLDSLRTHKVLIKVRLEGKNYERLTILTGFRSRLSKSFFLLGTPNDFREAVADMKPWKMYYEFTGPDYIQYSFSSRGGEFYRDQLCLPFPEKISRYQRRRYFRLEAPDGTMLEFRYGQIECREKVVDVSVGGALIALVCYEEAIGSGFPFTVGDLLKDVELTIPSKPQNQTVRIRKAKVIRFDNGAPTAKTCCGLEFIEIEQEHLKALTDFIYTHQRRFLRNRLKPDL